VAVAAEIIFWVYKAGESQRFSETKREEIFYFSFVFPYFH
jgi:hypothetical protein